MSDPTHYMQAEKTQMKTAFFATKPTGWTRYLRTSLPWQLVRFAVINLKMILIIAISHRGRH